MFDIVKGPWRNWQRVRFHLVAIETLGINEPNLKVAGSRPAGLTFWDIIPRVRFHVEIFQGGLHTHNGDTLAEWLRRQPAKLVGSARVGSNPTGVVTF